MTTKNGSNCARHSIFLINFIGNSTIIFQEIEKIVQRICEILKNLDRMSAEMEGAEMPIDVQTSQSANAKHQELYPLIAAVPIDEFKAEIQSLRTTVLASGQKQCMGGAKQEKVHRNGSIVSNPNPDLISVFPHLEQLLLTLVTTR